MILNEIIKNIISNMLIVLLMYLVNRYFELEKLVKDLNENIFNPSRNNGHDFEILKKIKEFRMFLFFFSPKGYFTLKKWSESTAIIDVPFTAFTAVDFLQACGKL